VFRTGKYVDVLPGIHKLDGIHLLTAHLGVDLDHALAVGDYLNDLPVFESFSRVLCPENAHPRIKALAQSKGARGQVSALPYGAALLDFLVSM
jgi:hydroxymethylpyrimidine pyrophosphatase-like HAD family hydrolase